VGMSFWKDKAKRLKTEVYVLYLAYKDPGVPLYAKLFAAAVIAYALNPLDLIPDFIPVLGYVDDLILIPLGVFLALKMIPKEVLDECRERARSETLEAKPKSRIIAAVFILMIWLAAIYMILKLVRRLI